MDARDERMVELVQVVCPSTKDQDSSLVNKPIATNAPINLFAFQHLDCLTLKLTGTFARERKKISGQKVKTVKLSREIKKQPNNLLLKQLGVGRYPVLFGGKFATGYEGSKTPPRTEKTLAHLDRTLLNSQWPLARPCCLHAL